MRIEVDRELCVAGGMCVLTAPDLFAQDPEDGRAVRRVEQPPPQRLAAARRVVELCPSGALSLHEDER